MHKLTYNLHKLAYNVHVNVDLELKELLVNASDLVDEVSHNLSLPTDGVNAILSSRLNYTEVLIHQSSSCNSQRFIAITHQVNNME